jgi:hypothetical protein
MASRARLLILFGGGLALLALCFNARIRGDGVAYFSYLPALVADHSFNLAPVFDRFVANHTPVSHLYLNVQLATGRVADYKPVGPALIALPFYVVTHLIFLRVPGYQDPAVYPDYQLAFTAASLACVLAAGVIAYRFARARWGAGPAGLAIAAVGLATPLTAYTLFESGYNHTFSVFTITAFCLYLLHTHPNRTPRQWLILGGLGSLMTLTHIQEGIYLILVPIEAIWLVCRRAWSWPSWRSYLAFAGAGLIVAIPQLIVDIVIYGRLFPLPAPNISFDFFHPHLLDLLISTHHGWLSWSPLVIVALLGLPLVVRKLGWFAAGLIIAGVIDFWVNASLSDWWGGLAFGARRLTDQSLLLVLGFSAVFSWLRDRAAAWVPVALVAAGAVWNTLLLAQYYYILVRDIGPSWGDFISNQFVAVGYVPRLFAQGTVIRDVAAGNLNGAAYTLFVLAGIVATIAALVGMQRRPDIATAGAVPQPHAAPSG